MKSSRLAKRTALFSLAILPFLLGAQGGIENWGVALPSLPDPDLPYWFAACDRFRVEPPTVVTASLSGCNVPEFAMNVDPVCSGLPHFAVIDGKVYNATLDKFVDVENLLGGQRPNATSIPVVQVRPDRPDIVVLFFGHAPLANTTKSPRAYFIALNREKFAPDAPLKDYFVASWPLELDEEENRGCGTIHLAAAAENPAYPNSATVFVSTCKHAYGYRLQFNPYGLLSSVKRFYDETRKDALAGTHHRAEMVVAPVGDNYFLLWPYENESGVMLSATVLNADGDALARHERHLQGISEFIKGLEVDRDLRTVYVTSPSEPEYVLAFELFDKGGNWRSDLLRGKYPARTNVGWSQIEMGPNGTMYMVTEKEIIVGYPRLDGGIEGFLSGSLHFEENQSGASEQIRVVPSTIRGQRYCARDEGINHITNFVNSGGSQEDESNSTGSSGGVPSSGDDLGSNSSQTYGGIETCDECLSLAGAYTHQCNYEWSACLANTTCMALFDRDQTSTSWGSTKACNLFSYVDDPLNAQILQPEGIKLFLQLEYCVKCTECSTCATQWSYCNTLGANGAGCP